MIKRTLKTSILTLSKAFPVLLLTGPRQVGKTTLLELCAEAGRRYVTLDDLDLRTLAQKDPGLFIQTYKAPIIIDEIQYAPQLLSYIKMEVDKSKQNGLYWLTGSQKFQLMKGIHESLAGRVSIMDLLGLSQSEMDGRADSQIPFLPTQDWLNQMSVQSHSGIDVQALYRRIWMGSYPRVYEDNSEIVRNNFYRSYIQTYLQRDVRDVLSVLNEIQFYNFLTAAAARTGQLLNYSDLARDVGIDSKTAKSWMSVLETSGIVYLLQPYFNNRSKRLVKTPKLYFLDTGLCSYLTKWTTPDTLSIGAMSGAMLETYIFSEILKSYWHVGKEPFLFFYRDTDQKEIDLIIEDGDMLYPVEFKKTATPSKTASKHFPVLEKLGKKVGPGAVLCLTKDIVPLSERVTAIPISYL